MITCRAEEIDLRLSRASTTRASTEMVHGVQYDSSIRIVQDSGTSGGITKSPALPLGQKLFHVRDTLGLIR